MKPFLILQLRPVDAAADGEFDAFLKYGGLKEEDVHRVRMEKEDVPDVNLDDYSAIIIGGGPSNSSDKPSKKSPDQVRFESQLFALFDRVFAQDFPLLACCYGQAIVSDYLKTGTVSKKQYSENAGAVDVYTTEDGASDPLLAGLVSPFRAMVGHKEATQFLPDGAVWLAKGDACPYQMYRMKENIYTTQFHPELDAEGFATRVDVYKNAGYFAPEEAEPLKQRVQSEQIHVPHEILKRFVDRYKQG